MIADIIREVFKGEEKAKEGLLDQSIVCGNLFKSFDQFTQHVIFLLYAHHGSLSRREVLDSMSGGPMADEGRTRFASTVALLLDVKVISTQDNRIVLTENFSRQFNGYVTSEKSDRGEPCSQDHSDFFNLLHLLQQNSRILEECGIGGMTGSQPLTKKNFDFLRLPIGYKIVTLIKGYLRYKKPVDRRKTLRNILTLSEMDFRRRYKVPESSPLLQQLQTIRLIRTVGGYFMISPYLHNFAFEQKTGTRLLDCSIIVETNFKVYVQIPRGCRPHNYRLVQEVMRRLIRVDHQDYELEELLVGEIHKPVVLELLQQGISTQDFLAFFLEFMEGDLRIEKDLGRWNKIKFLGLQGPENEMRIPNNVRQQIKLWEVTARTGDAYDTVEVYAEANTPPEGYY